MAKTGYDAFAIVWSVAVIAYLGILTVGLFCARKRPFLAMRGARFMMAMCCAAIVHVAAATVAHQHSKELEAVERLSCVLWGYWLPYLAVGVWFSAQFLQVLSYAAMLALSVSRAGTRRVIFSRPFVAVVTMTPPVIIAVVVSASPDVSRVDAETGACQSKIGAKVAVAVWIAVCVVALAVGLAWSHRIIARDASREMPRQWTVLAVAVAMSVMQVLVVVVAAGGFDDVVNRVVATLTIDMLYVVAMSVLAARPLWKVLRRDATYEFVEAEKLRAVHQQLGSVLTLMDHTADAPVPEVELIIADFLLFCSEPGRERMVRHDNKETHPSRLVNLYVAADAWTRRRRAATAHMRPKSHVAPLYGRKATGGFPPLRSEDITRTAANVVSGFFDPPYGESTSEVETTGELLMPRKMAKAVATAVELARPRGEEPSDTFREVLWWVLETLDAYFGEMYMTEHIMHRAVWLSEKVRNVINAVANAESLARLQTGGVIFDSVPPRLDTGPGGREMHNGVWDLTVSLNSSSSGSVADDDDDDEVYPPHTSEQEEEE